MIRPLIPFTMWKYVTSDPVIGLAFGKQACIVWAVISY